MVSMVKKLEAEKRKKHLKKNYCGVKKKLEIGSHELCLKKKTERRSDGGIFTSAGKKYRIMVERLEAEKEKKICKIKRWKKLRRPNK